jgi:hypothetical protein
MALPIASALLCRSLSTKVSGNTFACFEDLSMPTTLSLISRAEYLNRPDALVPSSITMSATG